MLNALMARRRRRVQYLSCTTKERKSSQPPETAVPVLKLSYQKPKIQPGAGDGGSSTKVVLPERGKIPLAAGDGGSRLYYLKECEGFALKPCKTIRAKNDNDIRVKYKVQRFFSSLK